MIHGEGAAAETGFLVETTKNSTLSVANAVLATPLVESRKGAVARRFNGPVSLPRSSNRTCGFPASGSPTGFTPKPTAWAQDARV